MPYAWPRNKPVGKQVSFNIKAKIDKQSALRELKFYAVHIVEIQKQVMRNSCDRLNSQRVRYFLKTKGL